MKRLGFCVEVPGCRGAWHLSARGFSGAVEMTGCGLEGRSCCGENGCEIASRLIVVQCDDF